MNSYITKNSRYHPYNRTLSITILTMNCANIILIVEENNSLNHVCPILRKIFGKQIISVYCKDKIKTSVPKFQEVTESECIQLKTRIL